VSLAFYCTKLRLLLSSTTHHSSWSPHDASFAPLLRDHNTPTRNFPPPLPLFRNLSLSLSLRLLTFVACSNSLDSSLSFFPHLSLHSCVYIYVFISITSTNTFVFQFQIPVFEFCLSFLSVFLRFWRSDFVSWFRAFELLEILVFSFFLKKIVFSSFLSLARGVRKERKDSLVFCGERKKVILRILFFVFENC
jgi:hypothetical protein